MRFLIVTFVLCLTACGPDPRAYGITGPGQIEQPKPAGEAVPGGDITMPQAGANTGNGKYWGYN